MIVVIDKITCGYDQKILIRDLSFQLTLGEAICILGANGIGKTTLFKTIIGQIKMISGDVFVNDKSVKTMSTKERSKIFSYVPQAKAYTYRYTVNDIVMMGRAPYIEKFSSPSQQDYKAVQETLDKLSLNHLSNRFYDELSGGEQQIVLIARAIAQNANYILLDEPASNLDFYNQSKLIRIINMMKQEKIGVLMVSHNPEHAFQCCEKALLIGKSGQYFYGETSKTITEDNLKIIYETDVGIKTFTDANNDRRYSFYVK